MVVIFILVMLVFNLLVANARMPPKKTRVKPTEEITPVSSKGKSSYKLRREVIFLDLLT